MPTTRWQRCLAMAFFLAACVSLHVVASDVGSLKADAASALQSSCSPCTCKEGAGRHQQARVFSSSELALLLVSSWLLGFLGGRRSALPAGLSSSYTCAAAPSIAIVQLRSISRMCTRLLQIILAAAAASVQACLVAVCAAGAPATEARPSKHNLYSRSSTESYSLHDSAWEGSAERPTDGKQSTSDAVDQESVKQDPCCLKQQQQQQQQPCCGHNTSQAPATLDEPAGSIPAAPFLYVATSGSSFPSGSTQDMRYGRSSFDACRALASLNACSALGSFDVRCARARPGMCRSFDSAGVRCMDACSSDGSSTAVNALVGPGWSRVLSFNSSSSSISDSPSGVAAAAVASAQQQDDLQGIKLGVLLGAGSFGKVYRARWRQQDVAVKVLHLLGSKAAAKAMAEAAVMLRARHHNVVAAHHVTMWQRAQQRDAAACCLAGGPGRGCLQLPDTPTSCFSAGRIATDSSSNSSSSDAAVSISNPLTAGTASTNVFSSSSGGNSTSIIEGGWGEDELRELGHVEDEDDAETQAWIVLELCDGTLDTAARMGKLNSRESQLSSLLDVAQGMAYLHGSSIVHGDLKAGNVCYVTAAPDSSGSSRLTCKVTDFTMTRVLDAGKTHCSTTSLGAITHVAPEVLLSGKQTKAGDVHSYGLLIWEVLHGRPPYSDCRHEVEIMEQVLLKQRHPAWDACVLQASPELVALAEQCWSSNVSRRPSFECICQTLQTLLQAAELRPQQQEQQQLRKEVAATDLSGCEWMQLVKAGGSCYAAKEPAAAAAAAAAPAGSDDGSAGSEGCCELQRAVSVSISTSWLLADEGQEMLHDALCCSTADSCSAAPGTPSAATPFAAAASSSSASLKDWTGSSSRSSSSSGRSSLDVSSLRWRAPLRRTVSQGAGGCHATSVDPLLYTIPEVPLALVQLDAVSDGGAGCSADNHLDALHQADQGLVKTLGRVRRLSNSSSCSAGAFAAGLDGGFDAVADAAAGFEAEAAAAALQLQQLLLSRQGAAAGAGGSRLSRSVCVKFGELAADDPAAGWLLGLRQPEGASDACAGGVESQGHEPSGDQQSKQHVYASAGPALGPCSGYW